MIKKFVAAIGLVALLNPVNQAKAEVKVEFDEFTGLTTVRTIPSNFTGEKPGLWLNLDFEGKINTQVPDHVKFIVINKGGYCDEGITGVLADGKRVRQAGEFSNKFNILLKYEDLGRKNYNLRGWGAVWGFYRPQEFLQIAQAQEVRYQFCGNKSYTLSPSELGDLKEFAEIVFTSPVLEKMPEKE